MTEKDRDESKLEQRLRDHYQLRYAQPLDPMLIWARVQPLLAEQEDAPSEPARRQKWLTGLAGFLAARRRTTFTLQEEEDLFMKSAKDEHLSEISTPPSRLTQHPQSLRRRVLRTIEASIAAILVASLVLGWLALARSRSSQGASQVLFTYTSQPQESIYSFQWTPDGKYLTFDLQKEGTTSYRFLAWDAATGKVKQTLSLTLPPDVPTSWSSDIVDSFDGRYALAAIAGSPRKAGGIKLINMLTGHVQQIYQAHSNITNMQVAFSNDSKYVALIGDDQRIHVWSIVANKFTLASDPIKSSGSIVLQIAWSQDGKRLVTEELSPSGGHPNVLQIWDAPTGQKIGSIVETPTMWILSPLGLPLRGAEDLGPGSGLSPNLQYILTYNQQTETVAERETGTLRILHTFHAQLLENGYKISPAGFLEQGSFTSPEWLADGKLIFLENNLLENNKHVYVWNAATGQLVTTSSSLMSTDRGLRAQGGGRYVALHQGKVLQIWDLLTGTKIKTVSLASSPVGVYSFWQDDGKHLNFTDGHGHSQIYNAFTGQLVATYQGDQATLSSNGKYLATANDVPDPRNKNGYVLNSVVQVLAIHG